MAFVIDEDPIKTAGALQLAGSQLRASCADPYQTLALTPPTMTANISSPTRRRLRWVLSPVAFAVCVTLGLGCGHPPTPERPVVLVSVPPQAWFVQALAADLVDVVVLVPPGASPAHHEPGVDTMRALTVASLWFKVGHPNFPFEAAWLDRLLTESDVLAVVSTAPDALPGVADDPHLWLSPQIAAGAARRLTSALVTLLPGQAALLQQRSDALIARIEEVGLAVTEQLAPYQGRTFFVFHPAWGWFADHVGIEQVAIEHDHKLPSLSHLAESIDLARDAGCRVVFVQPQFSDLAAQQVAEAIEAKVVVIDPLAGAWDENLLSAAHALADGFSRS